MGKHLAQKSNNETKSEKQASINDPEKATKEIKILIPNISRQGKAFQYISIAAAFAFLLLIRLLHLDDWRRAVYLIPFLIAAVNVILDGIEKVISGDYFADEIVIILSGIILMSTGLCFEAVLLIILYRCEKIIVSFFSEKSGKDFDSVSSIIPDSANVETAEGVITVAPDYIKVGDVCVVNPGEKIPVDGVIIEGITTIDTAAVSGQNSPWAVSEKYRVYSGCINLTSTIRVKAVKPFEQSTANKLVHISEKSTEFSSSQQNTIEKIGSYYSKAVLALAFVIAVLVPVFRGEWAEHLRRAAIILIAARPVLFMISVPLAYKKGLGLTARKGVFMKGADCIESVSRADTVIFDKTGTITEGRYVITEVYPEKISERDLLTIAAAAELHSRHPIARTLREAVGKIEGLDPKSIQTEEIPGRGVSAFVGSKQVYVGNTFLLEEHGIKCSVPVRSGSAIHVAVNNIYCGYILVSDKVRRGAFDALENLRACGVKKMVLLTGDVLSVARPLASKLNFDMLRAELKAEDKIAAVDYLMSNKGERTAIAFVGDGDRDGQMMRRVNVGISVGSLGSEAVYSDADVLIMDRDIKKLPWSFKLSRKVFNVVRENFFAGLFINILIIVLSCLGAMPALAAIILEFVFLAAVLVNTLRIK